MREIKFQFIYKGLPFSSEDERFNWHKKVYSLEMLINNGLPEICDVHNTCKLIAKRQYTGVKDANGVEIYEGDILEDGTICGYPGTKSRAIVKRSEECGPTIYAGGFYADNIYDEIGCSIVLNDKCQVVGNIYEHQK